MNEDRMSDAFVSARELAIDEQADLYDEAEYDEAEYDEDDDEGEKQ